MLRAVYNILYRRQSIIIIITKNRRRTARLARHTCSALSSQLQGAESVWNREALRPSEARPPDCATRLPTRLLGHVLRRPPSSDLRFLLEAQITGTATTRIGFCRHSSLATVLVTQMNAVGLTRDEALSRATWRRRNMAWYKTVKQLAQSVGQQHPGRPDPNVPTGPAAAQHPRLLRNDLVTRNLRPPAAPA